MKMSTVERAPFWHMLEGRTGGAGVVSRSAELVVPAQGVDSRCVAGGQASASAGRGQFWEPGP